MPDSPAPTNIQERLLRHLEECERGAAPPSYRELAAHFGWKAVGTVRGHLAALARKGLLELSGGRARSLKITAQGRAWLRKGTPAQAAPLPGGSPMDRLARDLLALLGPRLRKEHHPAGACLWREGEPAGRCILIERGRIMAFRTLPSGRSISTCLRGPGEIVGFAPLFDGGGYPTTVRVLEPVEAWVLTQEDLLKAAGEATTALALFRLFALRLREVFRAFDQFGHRSAIPKVAAFLAALGGEPSATSAFRFVTLPIASGTLARALGLAPETFSRAMGQLVSEGVLHRLSARRFQVLDWERLQQLAAPAEAG